MGDKPLCPTDQLFFAICGFHVAISDRLTHDTISGFAQQRTNRCLEVSRQVLHPSVHLSGSPLRMVRRNLRSQPCLIFSPGCLPCRSWGTMEQSARPCQQTCRQAVVRQAEHAIHGLRHIFLTQQLAKSMTSLSCCWKRHALGPCTNS